jgi:hypothetical protein
MLASRVTVGPVDDSPFVVPLILTKKIQLITLLDILNPWGKIDIMSDQHGLTITDAENNPLVTTSLEVISEHFFYQTGALHLDIAQPVFISRGNLCCPSGFYPTATVEVAALIKRSQNQNRQKNKDYALSVFHFSLSCWILVIKLSIEELYDG